MAFPMVPVNPLAGGRERQRVRKDPNKKPEWKRKETRLVGIEKPEGKTCYSRSKQLPCFYGLIGFFPTAQRLVIFHIGNFFSLTHYSK